jgi:hypothetical protein
MFDTLAFQGTQFEQRTSFSEPPRVPNFCGQKPIDLDGEFMNRHLLYGRPDELKKP